MERIEKRVGSTTFVIEINIDVKEAKHEDGKPGVGEVGYAHPMKGKSYDRMSCTLCGKEIGVNALTRHMRKVHNVSK